MKSVFTLALSLSFLAQSFSQQVMLDAIPLGACKVPNATNKTAPITPSDGSGTLGQTYIFNKCGLNYVTASNKLGHRFSPPGPVQPVAYAISGMPSCAIIEKAFLYMDASGNGLAVTSTITNPALTTQNFPITQIVAC